MADSKFAGMFNAPVEDALAIVIKAPAKGKSDIRNEEPPAGKPQRVRPLSKAKDPNYKGFFVLLKKDTQADASYRLKKQDRGEDFSDLVERLLSDWLASGT